MKTYIYAKPRETDYEISAVGECPSNCDAITAIGRSPEDDEIIGCGLSEAEAFENAILDLDI